MSLLCHSATFLLDFIAWSLFEYARKIRNTLKFGSGPYTKVKCLKYSRDNKIRISFLEFTENDFSLGFILNCSATQNYRQRSALSVSGPISKSKKPKISSLQKKDFNEYI